VSIGAPRLRQLGLPITDPIPGSEHRLYDLLSRSAPDSAHSRYNALVRRLVSFERAMACALADATRIQQFMKALGREADRPAHEYLTGGATAVLYGWRESTSMST
jgi:hypothetical protein